ncbi:MAG: hypothetical protein AB1411_13285 [Nitrospirota bacterium]
METKRDDELSIYREHLLEQLRTDVNLVRQEEPGSLQVFVNQECVGTLECSESRVTLAFTSQERPIHLVEIRTAAGRLAGALCLDGTGVKQERFHAGRFLVEAHLRNQSDRGILQVACHAVSPARQRIRSLVTGVATGGRWDGQTDARVLGFRPGLSLAAQVVLATAVAFLVADRLTTRSEPGGQTARILPIVESTTQKLAAMEETIARQEQVLARLAQAQQVSTQASEAQQEAAQVHRAVARLAQAQQASTQTLQAQQQQIAQVHQAVEAMDQRVRTDAAALRQLVGDSRKGFEDAVERHVRLAQIGDEKERAQLRSQVQQLVAARDVLSREVAALKSREVEQGLKQQAVVMARILSPQEAERKTAEVAEVTVLPGPTSVPAKAGEVEAQPFTFWVSFQDGTSEENIERLIHAIQGRRGPTNAGWYNVEVNLPKPQTPEGFFESLKREKIVKAVTLTRNGPAGK